MELAQRVFRVLTTGTSFAVLVVLCIWQFQPWNRSHWLMLSKG